MEGMIGRDEDSEKTLPMLCVRVSLPEAMRAINWLECQITCWQARCRSVGPRKSFVRLPIQSAISVLPERALQPMLLVSLT